MKNKVLRCECASIEGRLGDISYNALKIGEYIRNAVKKHVDVLTFSEMALTGYSCGDILYNQYLYDQINCALGKIVRETLEHNVFIVIGTPVRIDSQVYNCAVVIQSGSIIGVVPKVNLNDHEGSCESRWFSEPEICEKKEIVLAGYRVPFSPTLTFYDLDNSFRIGIVIGMDFDSPISMANILVGNGVELIVNLATMYETVTRYEQIQDMVKVASMQNKCAYMYVSAGKTESTTDNVFSNYMGIYENGKCLNQTAYLVEDSENIMANVDIECIQQERIKKRNLHKGILSLAGLSNVTHEIKFQIPRTIFKYPQKITKEPFLEGMDVATVCQRIIHIQGQAILKKMQYSKRNKLILGISGGLDSTVALLACCSALKKADIPLENIIGVTMPGPGTTNRTYQNSLKLMTALGITVKDIEIKDAVVTHLRNIKHPADLFDTTYEQTQSRERTKILMDLANKEKGIVVGTGDMSEIALGWMSYSGDQISMYGLNSGVPKTVIKHLAQYYKENAAGTLKNVLQDILETPVSPELLPITKDGEQKQKTEEFVGPYIVQDFYLYYFIKYGYSAKKILTLAYRAFKDIYRYDQLKEWLITFVNRFYTRQFKRTCFPDGVQVFDISLSPRNGWRMPSDVFNQTLLEEVKGYKNEEFRD